MTEDEMKQRLNTIFGPDRRPATTHIEIAADIDDAIEAAAKAEGITYNEWVKRRLLASLGLTECDVTD